MPPTAVATPVAIRSNAPAGAPAPQQPLAPTATSPSVEALLNQLPGAVTRAFRANSSPMKADLDDMTMGLGQESQVQIINTGLAYRMVTEHVVSITLGNPTAGALVASFGLTWPWNMLANTAIDINGGQSSYSCSGYGGLLAFGRDRNGFFSNPEIGQNFGLSRALCRVALVTVSGTGGSLVASGSSLSGLATVSIPANSTGRLDITFYTFEKIAFSRSSLLGALPLQNNAVSATLRRRTVGALTGPGNASPFFSVGAGLAINLVSWTAKTTYEFCSVPASPQLYLDMVNNVFVCIEQPSNTVSATGPQALRYNVPGNNYLTALHVVGVDGNGSYVNQYNVFSGSIAVKYSGQVITAINTHFGRDAAEKWADYNSNLAQLPGYLLWDGNDTADSLALSDDMGWIDTYSASSPQLLVDVGSVSLPMTYSVIREAVLDGSARSVGG